MSPKPRAKPARRAPQRDGSSARELLVETARAGAPVLTFALPKGRMAEETGELFAAALGVDPAEALAGTRRLAHDVPVLGLRFLSLRGADVPTYVEHGAADLGVTGLDVLREEERDLYEPLRLPLGRCRLIVASRPDAPAPPPGAPLKIATKYPRLAAEHYARAGVPVEIVPLHGSIEIAPVLALCDRIVDLTETGETLRANGLVIEEEVLASSATVVVNRVSLKLHPERIRAVLAALRFRPLRADSALG